MTGNSYKWLSAASQGYLPKISLIVVTTLLAYQMAVVTWSWLSPPWQGDVYAPYIKGQAKQDNSALDVATIINQHLFGEVSVVEQKPAEVIKAPETRLKLELRGVISTGKESGSAIIADESRSERYYQVGDTVAGSAKLHEVHPTKVILERGGRFETLSLPENSLGADVLGQQNSAGSDSFSAPSGAEGSPEVQELLKQYRDTLINEPQSLMDAIRTTPVNRGGKMYGYRIYPGRDRNFMIKLGLRAGDIITSINGVALDSVANGMEIFQQLSTMDQLDIQLDRNGTSKNIVFTLNE